MRYVFNVKRFANVWDAKRDVAVLARRSEPHSWEEPARNRNVTEKSCFQSISIIDTKIRSLSPQDRLDVATLLIGGDKRKGQDV